jgi:excisionase family DNA binding protein
MTERAQRRERLLTAREVAELLSVPESWVREQTRIGQLPHLPLGRYRRYRLDAVLEWIHDREAGNGTARTHQPRIAS